MPYSFEKATSELRTPMVNPVDMPLYRTYLVFFL
jgi:hypothetical protein